MTHDYPDAWHSMDLVAEHRLRMLRTSNAYAKWQAMQKSLPNTSSKLSIKIEQVLEVCDSWPRVQEGDIVVYMALCPTICWNGHVSMQTSVILLLHCKHYPLKFQAVTLPLYKRAKKTAARCACQARFMLHSVFLCIDTLRFNLCLMSQ